MNTPTEEIVKVMERGQITLPIDVRRYFGLEPSSHLIVRVTDDKKISLEPLKKKTKQTIQDVLKEFAGDKKVYWTAADERRRMQTRRASTKRIRELWK